MRNRTRALAKRPWNLQRIQCCFPKCQHASQTINECYCVHVDFLCVGQAVLSAVNNVTHIDMWEVTFLTKLARSGRTKGP